MFMLSFFVNVYKLVDYAASTTLSDASQRLQKE